MKSVSVELRGITKEFKAYHDEPRTDKQKNQPTYAVKDVNFTAQEGEFVTLLGPSGCGKTTTLRMIAGFEEPTGGDILFGGASVKNLPPHKRNASMVFQSYALFPHMTVFENIAYGLRLRKMPDGAVNEKVHSFMENMGLKGMGNRLISQLSGGQQQRVALTRALITEPSVLLFDEPLSNLDAKLRVQMREEIRSLQKRLNITAIYVTHDQEEAMVLSDKMIVMNRGEIAQMGGPQDIYHKPSSRFVAEFMGNANFVIADILEKDGAQLKIRLLGQEMSIRSGDAIPDSKNILCMFRPEAVALELSGDSSQKGIIKHITNLGSHIHVTVDIQNTLIQCLALNSASSAEYHRGKTAGIRIEPSRVHILKDEFPPEK